MSEEEGLIIRHTTISPMFCRVDRLCWLQQVGTAMTRISIWSMGKRLFLGVHSVIKWSYRAIEITETL